jgi:hypothetical protein
MKIEMRGHHFDTIEVIETESQAVLNTLTEHDFQNTLKNDRSTGNGAYARKETTSRVMVASRSKISFFLQNGRTSPWNYGWSFVYCIHTMNMTIWAVFWLWQSDECFRAGSPDPRLELLDRVWRPSSMNFGLGFSKCRTESWSTRDRKSERSRTFRQGSTVHRTTFSSAKSGGISNISRRLKGLSTETNICRLGLNSPPPFLSAPRHRFKPAWTTYSPEDHEISSFNSIDHEPDWRFIANRARDTAVDAYSRWAIGESRAEAYSGFKCNGREPSAAGRARFTDHFNWGRDCSWS